MDKQPIEQVNNDEIEAYVEFSSREEIIASCFYCISSIDSFNPITKIDTDRVNRIKKRCLIILDYYSKEMYDEIFDEDEE